MTESEAKELPSGSDAERTSTIATIRAEKRAKNFMTAALKALKPVLIWKRKPDYRCAQGHYSKHYFYWLALISKK